MILFLYFILQSEEATRTTATASSPETGHPEAPESSPPVRKSAMAKPFVDLFKTQVGNEDTSQLEKKRLPYTRQRAVFGDSDPLRWWKTNEPISPNYQAGKALPRPRERVFSTAGDNVTTSRSALTAVNVGKLIFLVKKYEG